MGILMALALQVDFDKPTNRRTVRVGATVNLRCHVLAVNLVVTTFGSWILAFRIPAGGLEISGRWSMFSIFGAPPQFLWLHCSQHTLDVHP